MATRTRLVAEYGYPGPFFPESTTRDVASADFKTVAAAGPDEDGYFRKDGWYAAMVWSIVEKEFLDADDHSASTWVRQSSKVVANYVVGTLKHLDDIPDVDPKTGRNNEILKSNIRGNSKPPLSGYGVLTRAGNWQIASDYTEVVNDEEV